MGGFVAALAAFKGSVVGFFAAAMAKEATLTAVAVAAFIAASAALATAINAGLSGLVVAYPVGWVGAGLGMLPGATDECVAAITSAHAVRWLYDRQRDLIGLRKL